MWAKNTRFVCDFDCFQSHSVATAIWLPVLHVPIHFVVGQGNETQAALEPVMVQCLDDCRPEHTQPYARPSHALDQQVSVACNNVLLSRGWLRSDAGYNSHCQFQNAPDMAYRGRIRRISLGPAVSWTKGSVGIPWLRPLVGSRRGTLSFPRPQPLRRGLCRTELKRDDTPVSGASENGTHPSTHPWAMQ